MGYKQYREEWKRLYVQGGMSTTEIADQYGCHGNTVADHLKRIGVSMRGGAGSDYDKEREEWVRLYVDEGMTANDIAERFNCCHKVVIRQLWKAKVETSEGGGETAEDPAIRFMRHFDKKENGCWEWQNEITKKGYGRIRIDGRNVYAHRFSYEHHNEDDLGKMMCLHKCHNRCCVNPDHLYRGTHQDNMSDMVEAGRSLKGKKNPSAKLTRKEVREIKRLGRQDQTLADIAKRYVVSATTIAGILKGKSWTHV